MDSDIEIVEHGIVDSSQIEDVYPDFSQVKIEVHGADVAEKFLEDCSEHMEYEAIYLESDNGILESEDCIEKVPVGYPDQLPDEYIIPDEHATLQYADLPIKEEIDQFEGKDYTDFDEVPLEPCINEIPPDDLYHFKNKIILGSNKSDQPPKDIYHFKNKIILGSKPCQSSSEVSLRENVYIIGEPSRNDDEYQNDLMKENLTAVVLLEDWRFQLQQSASSCKECGILFSTPNALYAHKMTAHSFLVAVSKNVAVKSTTKPAFPRKSTGMLAVKSHKNIARKSTGSSEVLISKYCNHCNMVFTDHTALIKHLYELLLLKQFQCKQCDAMFNTQKDLVDHNTSHIKIEKTKIKKEKVLKEETKFKKNLLHKEEVKKKSPISPKKEIITIPMSVLFQCPKCNTHFLSAFGGLQHFMNCHPDKVGRKTVSCQICKRKLRDLDADSHNKQHELCTKFKVYKVTSNMFERALCKCPKCGVHFSEVTMKPHLRNCGKIPTAHCQKCNILIPKSQLESHSKKHDKQHLKPKDFIIVQHFVQNRSLKRKLAPIDTPMKKIKLESPTNKIKSAIVNQNKKIVIGGKIRKNTSQTSMKMAIKEVKETERKIKKINTLKFEKKGNKVRMYFCKNCNGCCILDSYRTTHLNKQCKARLCGRVICPECGLLFTKSTMKSHKALHKRRNLTIHDIVFYHIGTLKRIVPSIPEYPQCKDCKINFFSRALLNEHICGEDYETCSVCAGKFHNSAYKIHIEFHKLIKTQPTSKTEGKIMPELIKKYESLNMMWNIVYSCRKCDIVTDLYDKAVEHSQAHLNHHTTSKNIKCYICNLKFDESCWSKHSDLHSRMNIISKDLKILTYEPSKLLTEEWYKIFESLPEDQITQITDRSLYSYERGIQMKLLKDGRAEFTLYCCSICKICYQNNEIANHLNGACKTPANICKVCNIPFNDISSLKYHKLLHLNGIKKEEFRVVNFAKKLSKVKDEKCDAKKSKAPYVIYKCKNCNSCMSLKSNAPHHKCLTKSRTAKCNKCYQLYHKSYMPKHKQVHILHPDFTFKNIIIEYFDSQNKNNVDIDPDKTKYNKAKKYIKPAKVIKPPPTGNTSKPVKHDTSKTAKASTSNAAQHASSKPTPDTTKTAKAETKTSKVFKCKCGLHYTSLKTIEKHMETCSTDSVVSKENCSKCGLLFPTDVLVSHLCKHHSNSTKIIVELYQKQLETSFASVESTSDSTKNKLKTASLEAVISPSETRKLKLYKCSECNIYYMAQNTCYKHVYKAHQAVDPRQYIECKFCGLQFTINTLSVHILRHHQKDFSLDNVLIEEYHPPIGKEPPKIDIYIASEKLQSQQVTSSKEERVD